LQGAPDEVGKWRDLPTGVYRICEKFDRGKNEYGRVVVLKLETRSKEIFLVWAPRCLIFSLEENNGVKFIQNLGFKTDHDGRKYYDYRFYN